MEINVFDFRPVGYVYLLEKFVLAGMPNWHSSCERLLVCENGWFDPTI